MEASESPLKEQFKIQMDGFEGPLDLLLTLIQQNEMDIFTVELSKITEEYLDYIRLAQQFDLNVAGDYLVVAATLILMKSRALIPHDEDDEDIEEDDPELLEQRLEEYRQYQAVAEVLREKEILSRDRHFRQTDSYGQMGEDLDFYDLNIYDLYSAFKTILSEIGDNIPGIIQDEDWTVDEKMVELEELLQQSSRVKLTDYLRSLRAKLEIIVTFLAMLELIRLRRLIAKQTKNHGEIWIMANEALPQDESLEPEFEPETEEED